MGRFEKALEKSGKRVIAEPTRKIKNADGSYTQLYTTYWKGRWK